MKDSIQSVRKEIYRQEKLTGFSVVRFLLPFQTIVTKILLRLPINSRQVTLLWVVVMFTAYWVMLMGVLWAFVAGTLLIFFAIILDGTDGEVGRYKATQMTPEEDVSTFINGIYLDRISHMITTPLWVLSIGSGLYRITGDQKIFIGTIGLLMFKQVRRFEPFLKLYVRDRFQSRLKEVVAEGGFAGIQSKAPLKESIVSRMISKLDLWLKNGKRFNFVILVLAVADVCILGYANTRESLCLFWGIQAFGILGIFLLLISTVKITRDRRWTKEICREIVAKD